LTVQHAAREAARWAVTYRPVQGLKIDEEECDNLSAGDAISNFIGTNAAINCDPNENIAEHEARRVALIKEFAFQSAAGLRIDSAAMVLANNELLDTPGFFGVSVWGDTWAAAQVLDNPGAAGLPVQVRVVHNVELVDPFLRVIAPNGVRVQASANMVNEGVQVLSGNPTAVGSTYVPPTPPPT